MDAHIDEELSFAEALAYDDKMLIFEELLQQGIEKLCEFARDNNFLAPPYGKNVEPTPLITEEQFLQAGGLQCDDVEPEFSYTYGFDPLKFLADYLMWAHPDTVRARQHAKLHAQRTLALRARHAQHQLATQVALAQRVERLRVGVQWGPLCFPLSSTALRCVVKPFKSAVVFLQVSPFSDFSEIVRTYKLYARPVTRESERDTHAHAHRCEPCLVDIDNLQEKTQYFVRVLAQITEDGVAPFWTTVKRTTTPRHANGSSSKKGENNGNNATIDSLEVLYDEDEEEWNYVHSLFTHADAHTESEAQTPPTQSQPYFVSSCHTLPDQSLNLLLAATLEAHSTLSTSHSASNSAFPMNPEGSAQIVALKCIGQLPLRALRVRPSLSLALSPSLCDPFSVNAGPTHTAQLTHTTPAYTFFLGDFFFHDNDDDRAIVYDSTAYPRYAAQADVLAQRVYGAEDAQRSACVFVWRDSDARAGDYLKQEEVAHKQYRHELKRYNKKHGLDQNDKKRNAGRGARNTQAHSQKETLPPPPTICRPPPSPQLEALVKTFPMPGTSLTELEDTSTHVSATRMLYRSVSVGSEVQMFCVDTRRSLSLAAPGIDYLGKEQAEWLQYSLEQSVALWKIIVVGKSYGVCSETHTVRALMSESETKDESFPNTTNEDTKEMDKERDEESEKGPEKEKETEKETDNLATTTKTVQLLTPRSHNTAERERDKRHAPLHDTREGPFDRYRYSLQHVLACVVHSGDAERVDSHSSEKDLHTPQKDAQREREREREEEEWLRNSLDGILVRSGVVVLSGGLGAAWTRSVSTHTQPSPTTHEGSVIEGQNSQTSDKIDGASLNSGENVIVEEAFVDPRDVSLPPFVSSYYSLQDPESPSLAPITAPGDFNLRRRRVACCVEVGLGPTVMCETERDSENENESETTCGLPLHFLPGISGELHYLGQYNDGESCDTHSVSESDRERVTECTLSLRDDGALSLRMCERVLLDTKHDEAETAQHNVLFEVLLIAPAMSAEDSDADSNVHVA